jgi:CheY-like chemotaxis protein
MVTSGSPKYQVLYADDDPEDLQFVQEAFARYSPDVDLITVTDGIEALTYLKNLADADPAPCLVILDINMPRMSGKEALVSLRQLDRFEEIPVMLFTTSSATTDIEFAASYKAGFLSKPIDTGQMAVIINRFVNLCVGEVKKSMLTSK